MGCGCDGVSNTPNDLPFNITNGIGIVPFGAFTQYTPVIPKFYYDVYSLEEREKMMCKQIHKLAEYSNYLARNIEDLSEQIGPEHPAYNKVVMVEDYGAIGDGETDNTAAIQRAVDENPGAGIYFRKGVYCISDTIKLWGNAGGNYFNLNGSTLKWKGCPDTWREGDAVEYERNTQGNPVSSVPTNPKPMLSVCKNAPTYAARGGGHCIIANGTISGDAKASIGIQVLLFSTKITNLRITNVTYCGILNGSLDFSNWNDGTNNDVNSTQTMIDNVTIDKTKGNWSEGSASIGIMLTYPDNHISNYNVNRYKYGIDMRTSGNLIENWHYTFQTSYTIPASEWNGAAIRSRPQSASTNGYNEYNNCYFNSGKYVVFGSGSTQQNLKHRISDSHYTLYNLSSDEPREAFICGGAPTHTAYDNLNVLRPEHVSLRDYYPNSKLTMNAMSELDWHIRPTSNAGVDSGKDTVLLTANCKRDNTTTIRLCSSNEPLEVGKAYLVARLLCTWPSSDSTLTSAVKLTYSASTGHYVSGFLRPNADAIARVLWIEEENRGTPTYATFHAVENQVTINGVTYNVLDIVYNLRNVLSGIDRARTLTIEAPDTNNIRIYAKPYPTLEEYTGNLDNAAKIIVTNQPYYGTLSSKPWVNVLIGDSYLVGFTSDSYTAPLSWGSHIISRTPNNVGYGIYAQNQCGAWRMGSRLSWTAPSMDNKSHNFRTMMECTASDINPNRWTYVRNVVIGGGWNDAIASNTMEEELYKAIDFARTNYRLARITVAFLFAGIEENYTQQRANVRTIYQRVVNQYKTDHNITSNLVQYVEFVEPQIMGQGTWDGVHPSAEVSDRIAEVIYNAMNNDYS